MNYKRKRIITLLAIIMGVFMFLFDYFWSINELTLIFLALIGIVITIVGLLYLNQKLKTDN